MGTPLKENKKNTLSVVGERVGYKWICKTKTA
jgi:hypothetical protein